MIFCRWKQAILPTHRQLARPAAEQRPAAGTKPTAGLNARGWWTCR
jgi:hypothetical protein